ncbi:LOW QUALITY PROTEIN: hypothetical protein BRARA_A02357 [Brassica rapa]|uniref:Uncharacterized protein n=1 Tax=Brassica campestris TaxID=3711 RepID=A0A398AWC2_BRACM|nr:LOW QUALITY PROTEIN: hypothetical protein BRARA_A02357 [Brassica rapa]
MWDTLCLIWNTLIRACAHDVSRKEEAFLLYRKMLERGKSAPDKHTFSFVLKACAYILTETDSLSDGYVNNGLIHLYGMFRLYSLALQLYTTPAHHLDSTWSSPLPTTSASATTSATTSCRTSYIFIDLAQKVFNYMPDRSLVSPVLTDACNHRGIVNKGRQYFEMMVRDYGIEPALQWSITVVSLTLWPVQATLPKLLRLVTSMPMKPDAVIWRSLLDACCKNGASVEPSEEIATRLVERRKGDAWHLQTKQIYQQLKVIDDKLTSIGYLPDLSQAPLVDAINDGSKEYSLRLHSERLAIAFAYHLNPCIQESTRCIDCHEVTKLASASTI